MSIFQQFDEHAQKILRNRAERIASRAGDPEGAAVALNALMIVMQDEHYAIPIESIQVVHQDIQVEPVPCTPPHVAGVANVRGHMLPVIDLARFLGIASLPITGPVSLIVAGNNLLTLAFYVEQVGDVAPLKLDKMAPVPGTLSMEKAIHLQGVLPDGTILLDVEAILDDPALIVDEQAG